MDVLAALDVEATCIGKRSCRVVAAALVPFSPNGIVHVDETLYVRLEGVVAGESALVHGLTEGREWVRPNSNIVEFLEKMQEYTLVVYGRHDIDLILREARGASIDVKGVCYIDLLGTLLSTPSNLYAALAAGGYPLERACRDHVGLEEGRLAFHDPVTDAVRTALLYIALQVKGYSFKVHCTQNSGGPSLAGMLSSIARKAKQLKPRKFRRRP